MSSPLWRIVERGAAIDPSAEALVDGDRRRSWGELEQAIRSMGARLVAMGIEPGDRVAMLAHNGDEFLQAYFAVAGCAAVFCPLNHRLAPAELAVVLEDSGARVLLVQPDLVELARASVPPGSDVRVVGLPLEASDASAFEPREARADSLAQLYYTSGSTGRPKGVRLTHGNVATHAENAIVELGLSASERWAHVAPLFHLADAWAAFAITAVGGCHVMAPRFEPDAVLDLFARERVSSTNLVPTMLQRIVDRPAPRGEQLAMRLLLTGGAPIAPEVIRRALALFDCEYAQTYGLTETAPFVLLGRLPQHLAALPFEERLPWLAKTGRPFRGVEVRIVDEAGSEVPADDRTVGELAARGASVSPGYWNRPDETAAAFRDGWLYTGDLAVRDAEGFVTIVDRKKDVILTGGETVYSVEVEKALLEHPSVLEAAVFGRPDDEWGERIVAAVAPRAGTDLDAKELRDHCRQRLAGYKTPRVIRVVDALPRLGSGKIAKRLLRARELERGAAERE